MAPVVSLEERPAEASSAVGAKLAGVEVAVLAGRRRVGVGGALAAKVHVRADDPAVSAGERLHAAPFERSNPHTGQCGRAGLDAFAIQEVPRVAANTANVTGHRPIAILAVIVEAPAVLPEQGAALDSAAAAVD